jgi:hypothetical protein
MYPTPAQVRDYRGRIARMKRNVLWAEANGTERALIHGRAEIALFEAVYATFPKPISQREAIM